jgi:hypothetical protein
MVFGKVGVMVTPGCWLRVRLILRIAFLLGVVQLFYPALAAADCVGNANSSDTSQPGSPRLHASTTQSGCAPGTQTRTEGTIEGQPVGNIDCPSGQLAQNGYCVQNSSGTASVNVATRALAGYGTFRGISHHAVGSGFFETPRFTILDARSPADLCAAQGQEYSWNGSECVYSPGSPIVIATTRWARYRFTSREDGVLFDIDGDGVLEQIAWTLPDSDVAFLALDRDGDGLITSGRELFGNHTFPESANGFDALARTAMETNGGVKSHSVSSDDPVYAQLLLWTDRNHNGMSEPSELRPASEIISEIGLGYFASDRQDRHGNLYIYEGWAAVRTARGRNPMRDRGDEHRRITIFDIFFKMD